MGKKEAAIIEKLTESVSKFQEESDSLTIALSDREEEIARLLQIRQSLQPELSKLKIEISELNIKVKDAEQGASIQHLRLRHARLRELDVAIKKLLWMY